MLSIIVLGLSFALVATVALVSMAAMDVAFRGPPKALVPGKHIEGPLPQTGGTPRQAEPQCPTCRFHMIGVTPPEALAIVDTLRRKQSSATVQRIHDRAAENSRRAAELDREHYADAKIMCPLVAADDSCAAFDARPLHCRGWCHQSGEEHDQRLMADAQVDEGIVCGLTAAGLESAVYELNGALAIALETPDAAHRWAQSEAVFADCKRYG